MTNPRALDEWVLAPNHPTVDQGYGVTTPEANDMSLQDLVDWAHEQGMSLTDVRVEYGDCGSHAVELHVRQCTR